MDNQPEAVAPQEARQRARTAAHKTPSKRPQPGDLICGDCGEGNAPTRKFCSRCGCSLVEAVVVRTPWWRKILPKRKLKTHEVGARPGRGGVRRESRLRAALRGVFPLLRKIIAVVLLLGGILYASYTPFRGLVNEQALAVRTWFEQTFLPQYAPVRPSKVTATAELPEHGAMLVSDNATNTYWAAPGDPGKAALVFQFDQPVEVSRAIVRVGIAKEFQTAHRPQKLHLVYSTGKTFDLELKDTPDPQEVKIENSAGATSMELHVVGLHRSLKGTDVAISEIELFQLK